MAYKQKHKLAIACALLAASMLPLAVVPRWNGLRLAEPTVLFILLLTGGLALWGAFRSRTAWVLMIIRAGLQVLAMLMMAANISSYRSQADFLRAQAGVSLGLTLAAMWLLLSRSVRAQVWGAPAADEPVKPPRPISRLGTWGVLCGMGVIAGVLGSIEQAWLYGHVSAVELGLRSLYLLLPWAGAWLLARLGRDRIVLTTLGALLGELTSELLSLVASGADPETVFLKLLLPLANLPALLVGLALALCGPRRPLWQLGIALPLAQLLSRAAATSLTSPGSTLSFQAAALAVLSGMGCAAAIYRFRRTEPT